MSKKNKKSRSGNKGLVIALVLAVLALIAVICCLMMLESGDQNADGVSTPTAVAEGSFEPVESESVSTAASEAETQTHQQETTESKNEDPTEVSIEAVQETNEDLGQGLIISDIGSYVGVYMEDGSDEFVSGVLMLVLTNTSELPLEYAEIELTTNGAPATFTVSTLPAGASAVLLEQNRMPFEENMTFENTEIKHISFFDEPLDLCTDKLQIQGLNGVLNIINVTEEDITGDIEIYYKNSSGDMYYGGITYRVRITGGLKAKEVKQIVSDHFSESGSTVMFVKCG